MFNGVELDELRKYVGEDGKLIISDSLTDKQKERFSFINSLNINLVDVLTRKVDNTEDSEEEEEVLSSSTDDDVVEELDEEAIIEENDEPVQDLDNFF